MVVRTSAAEWHGLGQDGGGCVSFGSGVFVGPYSFGSRFGEEPGTIELATEGDVPGMDARTFSAHAEVAKRSCPVSKALAGVDISLTASLSERSESIVPRRSSAASAAHQGRTPVMGRRGSERFQRAR